MESLTSISVGLPNNTPKRKEPEQALASSDPDKDVTLLEADTSLDLEDDSLLDPENDLLELDVRRGPSNFEPDQSAPVAGSDAARLEALTPNGSTIFLSLYMGQVKLS